MNGSPSQLACKLTPHNKAHDNFKLEVPTRDPLLFLTTKHHGQTAAKHSTTSLPYRWPCKRRVPRSPLCRPLSRRRQRCRRRRRAMHAATARARGPQALCAIAGALSVGQPPCHAVHAAMHAATPAVMGCQAGQRGIGGAAARRQRGCNGCDGGCIGRRSRWRGDSGLAKGDTVLPGASGHCRGPGIRVRGSLRELAQKGCIRVCGNSRQAALPHALMGQHH